MAGEVISSASVAYNDGIQKGNLGVISRLLTSVGKRFTQLIQNVGIAEEAVQLGEITAIGAYFLINLDQTNYVEVKVGTGGAIRDKLKPDLLGDGTGGWVGGDCMGSGSQAPFVIANAAPCRIAVFVVDA